MSEAAKKNIHKIPVEIEFTTGYEQRFTAAVLKIYSNRKRMMIAVTEDKNQVAS